MSRDGLVEQVAVVRDRDDGAVERPHQQLEPLARLDVEMRLGLVEQQHIGVAEQARQRGRRAFAGRRRERASASRGRRRRGRRRRSSARARPSKPGPPAAVQRLDAAPPAGGAGASSARGRRRSSPSPASTCASSRSSSSRSGRDARSVSRASRSSPSGCCGRYATTRPRRCVTSPASACLLAGEDAEQRRLAAAVRADHAHADARLDVEVEPVEDRPRAEALRDPAHGEQSHARTVTTARAASSSPGTTLELGQPEGGFAEAAVAGDRRVVAVLVASTRALHPPRQLGILERVVEREHRDAEAGDAAG